MIVTTDVMRRLQSNMPSPQGPRLPMSDMAPRVGSAPTADIIAAVRDSGTVIAFLVGGAGRGNLTTRVYDVLTSPSGCGLGRSESIESFAAQCCDTPDGKRSLINALAVHRPTTDPTALATRQAVTAWVRAVGLAAHTRDMHEPATVTSSNSPDWQTPGSK
jgi:hypothetical protein